MDKFLRFQIRPSQLLERMLGRPVNFLRTSICPNLIATGWAQVWWPRTNVRESQISTPSGKFCLSMLKPSDTPSPIITGPRGPLKILQILEPLPLLREAGKQLLRMILTNSEMMAEEGEWDTLCPITGMSMLDCHPLWSHFSVTAAFAAQSLLTLLAEVQLTSFTGRPCRWWGGTGKCLRDGDACVHSVIFDVCVIVTSHPCVCVQFGCSSRCWSSPSRSHSRIASAAGREEQASISTMEVPVSSHSVILDVCVVVTSHLCVRAVRLLLTLLAEIQWISLTDRPCRWRGGTGK